MGSKEGWQPSAFRSSRAERAGEGAGAEAGVGPQQQQQSVEQYMDEDELEELRRTNLQTTGDYDTFGGTAAELARRGTVLEVCPGSNIALGLYPDRASHPLHRLIDAGVPVTLNSDDPPFFHTTLGNEYAQAGLDAQALRQIARTALLASFADEATKRKLLREIEP